MLRCFLLILCCLGALGQVRPTLADQPVIVITSFSAEVSGYLQQQLSASMPDLNLRLINKKTPAVLTHLEKNLYPRPDLVIMSAPDAFDWLSQQGQLTKLAPNDRLDYTPFGYSGYGLMTNQQYLQQHQLPTPVHWEDLLRPQYRGHIAMSTPSRSGTTHVIVETLLQEKGWRDGWAYLLRLAGNMSTITARSFGVRQGVINQRFGLGLTIDFFAFTAHYQYPEIGFVYPSPSSFLPVCAALVKGGLQPESARRLIQFLLGAQGQSMLLAPELSRFPVDKNVLEQHPDHLLNRYIEQTTQTHDYDSRLAVRRYQLVNALFDELITLRLEFMQQSWGALHEIRQQLDRSPNPELETLYQATLDDLLSVPFEEARLGDTKLLSSFAQVLPGAQLSDVQQNEMAQWQRWSRQQQDRVTHNLSMLKHQLAVAPSGAF